MSESNFSINFKMYNTDGLNAQFTVRADTRDEHINAITEYMAARSSGYQAGETIRFNYVDYLPVAVNRGKKIL